MAIKRSPANIMVGLQMQGHHVTGHYRGFEYLDLFLGPHVSGNAFDTINVYDYEAGKPRIPTTRAAVADEMRKYRDELMPHEIEEHLNRR